MGQVSQNGHLPAGALQTGSPETGHTQSLKVIGAKLINFIYPTGVLQLEFNGNSSDLRQSDVRRFTFYPISLEEIYIKFIWKLLKKQSGADTGGGRGGGKVMSMPANGLRFSTLQLHGAQPLSEILYPHL